MLLRVCDREKMIDHFLRSCIMTRPRGVDGDHHNDHDDKQFYIVDDYLSFIAFLFKSKNYLKFCASD